jgi:hypothetical protein
MKPSPHLLVLWLSALNLSTVPIALALQDSAVAPPSSRPCSKDSLKKIERDAARGSAEAQKTLGDFYAEGRCAGKNYARAALWYRRAARQGLPDAQFELAMFLLEGKEVRRDPVEAARWFRQAAEQGHNRAQYALGSLYVNGRGVSKDLVEGYRWIRVSAPKTDDHIRNVLAAVSESMSPSEISRAEAQAEVWRSTHTRSLPK